MTKEAQKLNPRDGMRRLRAERRAGELCVVCGEKLGKDTRFLRCPYCLAQLREYERKRRIRKSIKTEDKSND